MCVFWPGPTVLITPLSSLISFTFTSPSLQPTTTSVLCWLDRDRGESTNNWTSLVQILYVFHFHVILPSHSLTLNSLPLPLHSPLLSHLSSVHLSSHSTLLTHSLLQYLKDMGRLLVVFIVLGFIGVVVGGSIFVPISIPDPDSKKPTIAPFKSNATLAPRESTSFYVSLAKVPTTYGLSMYLCFVDFIFIVNLFQFYLFLYYFISFLD